jgi:predicted adenylyl cyclase CyaB
VIELEILVEVLDTYEKAFSVLSKFDYIKDEEIVDRYYYDPLRHNLKPNYEGKIFECFRLRNSDSGNILTYKIDVYNDKEWQYSNEHEVKIENPDTLHQILINLGFKELIILKNHRKYYKYGKFELVLEQVEDLGTFLEVEYKSSLTPSQCNHKRNEIRNFINSLPLAVTPELNTGKPELFIHRHRISV